MVMTYSQAKVQGQRLVGSKDRVETNGRTEERTDRRRRLRSVKIVYCIWCHVTIKDFLLSDVYATLL